LDEIIGSTPGNKGIPIGNYLSQYSGNFYLSSFDHWLKEVKGIKYSYKGWLMHCDSYRLTMKYIDPIQKHADDYYFKNIKRKAE
jgi:hypothetical protein